MLKEVFDRLFGTPDNAFTPEGIRQISGMPLVPTNVEDESNKIEADRINAVKQATSKGFRIFDINPGQLLRSDFFCVYEDVVLKNYVGSETLFEITPIVGPATKYDNENSPPPIGQTRQVQSAYWRTVQLPVSGNFLKIEFLPIRQNILGYVSDSPYYTDAFAEAQNTLELDNEILPGSNTLAGTEMILVDFETPSDKPLIARNGTTFETYFTNIYITFKQLSPRIRITVGQNSKVSEIDSRPVNLSVWDGKSLTKNSLQAPKQFCITDKDIASLGVAGFPIGTTAIGEVTHIRLINGPSQTGATSVFWLTDFSTQLLNANGISNFKAFDFELFVATDLGSDVFYDAERLTQATGVLNTDLTSTSVNPRINEPKRFQLQSGEVLVLRIIRTGGTNVGLVNLKFQVSGYSQGSLMGLLNPVTLEGQTLPFKSITQLTENPYPTDLERWGVPNV